MKMSNRAKQKVYECSQALTHYMKMSTSLFTWFLMLDKKKGKKNDLQASHNILMNI